MQKITSCLWFNNQAEEAVNFYTSIFKNSKVGDIMHYDEASAKVSGMPQDSVLTIGFELEGQVFTALNGGPMFTFSPAISFFVSCETEKEINNLWAKLSEGGKVLMEFQEYPFSKKYGWTQDKFGVSWQLNLASQPQKIIPCLLFVGGVQAKSEEAMNFYTSVFEDSAIKTLVKYEPSDVETQGASSESVGTVKHAVFTLDGVDFVAMDSGRTHNFSFTQAISFIINCETQEEVDKFWEKLSEGGQVQQCGWLIDKYGVPWQVVPTILDKLLADPDRVKSQRVMEAMLEMIKLDIAALKQAYDQE